MFCHYMKFESISVLSALYLDVRAAPLIFQSVISLQGKQGQITCILLIDGVASSVI